MTESNETKGKIHTKDDKPIRKHPWLDRDTC